VTGVVCVCSRGLVHSRTLESIHANIREFSDWHVLFTHDLPIPEAQNEIIGKALKYKPKYLWFLEEDVVAPPETLFKLLLGVRAGFLTVARYRLRGGRWSYYPENKPVFSGLGCLLAKTELFTKLDKPYFSTDTVYDRDLEFSVKKECEYGGQDVSFFANMKRNDIEFNTVDIECDHLKVDKFGFNSIHEISKVEVEEDVEQDVITLQRSLLSPAKM
jgi:hypothetical protein